jgi:GH35 family endo-1,4-beta-xylanase
MKVPTSITLASAVCVALATSDPVCVPSTGTSSLRDEAQRKDILIGSGAINPAYLEDAQFATVLAEQFNSLSPENELKWSFINPTKGFYNWTIIDRLVDFADEHKMVVKGHGLISSCCDPDFVLNITDFDLFRQTMVDHFEAIMHRYHGKVDRWDVVSEALLDMGGGFKNTTYYNMFGGSRYVGEAFRIAHAADPTARLFLNENLVETVPGKRQEFYELVSGLVRDNVPLHGIALQMHITEIAPVPGTIREMVDFFKNLGLETTIAELDVHTLNATLQTEIYGAVMEEALAAGITDISFWGFTDKHLYTWLPGAKPLMFDEEYNPKGAFYSTHEALADFVQQA